jgi:hypothetical protein
MCFNVLFLLKGKEPSLYVNHGFSCNFLEIRIKITVPNTFNRILVVRKFPHKEDGSERVNDSNKKIIPTDIKIRPSDTENLFIKVSSPNCF